GLWTRNDVESLYRRQRWVEIEDDQIENGTIYWASNPAAAGWNRQRRSSVRNYYLANPGTQPFGTVTRPAGEFNDSTYNGRISYYDYNHSEWRTLGTTMGYFDMADHVTATERVVDSTSAAITSHLWND